MGFELWHKKTQTNYNHEFYQHKKLSFAGFLVSIGIVFGDIGTSLLYVYSAIIQENVISELLVLGSASAIFWTLFFQTTVKYVFITLRAEQKGDKVIFAVQDFGKGIDQQYQSKIFDKYFRIPGSKKEGTGLGLAISKEFIESQNGIIYLTSTPGKGTTFFFTLEKSDSI